MRAGQGGIVSERHSSTCAPQTLRMCAPQTLRMCAPQTLPILGYLPKTLVTSTTTPCLQPSLALCVAMCCGGLQWVAVGCSGVQWVARHTLPASLCCNACSCMCCSVLQCVAACCSVWLAPRCSVWHATRCLRASAPMCVVVCDCVCRSILHVLPPTRCLHKQAP